MCARSGILMKGPLVKANEDPGNEVSVLVITRDSEYYDGTVNAEREYRKKVHLGICDCTRLVFRP